MSRKSGHTNKRTEERFEDGRQAHKLNQHLQFVLKK